MADDRTDPQYKLRWSEGLRDRITAAAADNKRSMNAEIIARLERSFRPAINDGDLLGLAADDMESAMHNLFKAITIARAQGGTVNLELKVDGISDDAEHHRISQKALKAFRKKGAPQEDPEGAN